ncbi:MAG: hypothetical protein K5695_14515 [Oscillospiraceae bacterium]|nr:hypothetical protein [Oscillospiraceae bacterium]
MKKCETCPYKLGVIKCVRDPCIECRASGRKDHPFTYLTPKQDHCYKCGGKSIVNGKCLACGAKQIKLF